MGVRYGCKTQLDTGDVAWVDQPINRALQMILRNVLFLSELRKQRRLCFLFWSHYR